jgi:hypothetical protein
LRSSPARISSTSERYKPPPTCYRRVCPRSRFHDNAAAERRAAAYRRPVG